MDRGLDVFDTLPADEAREQLLSCCAAPGWATAVTAGRPYRDRDTLAAQAREQVTALPWPQVAQAIAAHPRIGQPPAGDSREAGWSRREQSVAADGGGAAVDDLARAELITLNEAYEQRFGYRFLIFANGRGAAELAAAARQRLRHDDDTERAVVRIELGDIAALRVGRLLDDLAGAPSDQLPSEQTSVGSSPARYAPLSTHVLDTAIGTPAPDLPVRLDAPGGDGGWRTVAAGRTDADGRLRDWAPADRWDAGTYRLVFDVTGRLGADGFYTEIPVVFTVRDAARHHHVPLLLSPYGYTTYRGS
ncbi:2-oxo-4-hydroxy-4-carboxy-5-ureidoimidazoline decarboxylase [Micromonospora sp. LOL_023]|uniref:2-oxo-4-hydroxy-4-carboxy-5-ureidoimidazoline decarboxylase n=1 Tax=Micromonospora sp. LOL_023 TaxID=3345418 RepID=UPI003A86C7F4